MSGKTKIEWTDRSWNPVRWCSRVSAGCENCYAERVAHRFNGLGQPYEGLTRMVNGRPTWNGKITLAEHLLHDPLKWRNPGRIFVNSMSDLFHPSVPDEYIRRVWWVIAECERRQKGHIFQILTKRPDRMRAWVDDNVYGPAEYGDWSLSGLGGCDLANVWLGVSVEDQATAEQRIPHLLETPADVRWVSAEPLLGPVDLESVCVRRDKSGEEYQNCLSLEEWSEFADSEEVRNSVGGGALIDWVVAGGESGPGSRPAHPDWFRSLRDQCARSGTPFFFKQWGDWQPECHMTDANGLDGISIRNACHHVWDTGYNGNRLRSYRIGKNRAGRLLDGREHNVYPEHAQ